MSCPTAQRWNALIAHRLHRVDNGPEPEGWDEALAHLESCPACRRLGLGLDPTLVFRRLPRPEPGAGEVEAMRQAVAGLRRASSLNRRERTVRRTSRRTFRRTFRVTPWVRWAAAAALALAVSGLAGNGGLRARHDDPRPDAPVPPAPPASIAANTLQVGLAAPAAAVVPVSLLSSDPADASDSAAVPLVEDLDHPRARVYELGGKDLSVVMIVDQSLDV